MFSKPQEMTYRGDTLDPIHQIQVDHGYVIKTSAHYKHNGSKNLLS